MKPCDQCPWEASCPACPHYPAEPQAGAQQDYLPTSTFYAGRQLGQQEATPPGDSERLPVASGERVRILAWVKERVCDYESLPAYGATNHEMFLQSKGRVLQLRELETYLSQAHGDTDGGWKDRHPIGAQVPSFAPTGFCEECCDAVCSCAPKMADDPRCGHIRGQIVELSRQSAKRRGLEKPDINCVYTAGVYLAAALETHLNSIKSYATEAAKPPITRESILAVPQVDDAPIPDDLKYAHVRYCGIKGSVGDYYASDETKLIIQLIERVTLLTAEAGARKLHELAQYDEMQGLCRLILAESGGVK